MGARPPAAWVSILYCHGAGEAHLGLSGADSQMCVSIRPTRRMPFATMAAKWSLMRVGACSMFVLWRERHPGIRPVIRIHAHKCARRQRQGTFGPILKSGSGKPGIFLDLHKIYYGCRCRFRGGGSRRASALGVPTVSCCLFVP